MSFEPHKQLDENGALPWPRCSGSSLARTGGDPEKPRTCRWAAEGVGVYTEALDIDEPQKSTRWGSRLPTNPGGARSPHPSAQLHE